MVQSPSWAANWFTASQEIPRISRNRKVHYRTHKRPPPVSILGQPNPVHIPTSHLLEIHPNIIHQFTPRSPQLSLSLRFPHQDPIHPLSSPMHATCPAHLILLDFITRTILGEAYKSFSSSFCNHLHSPVTSSLLGPNILLNAMFSNTLSFLSSHNVSDQVSHPYKTTRKIIILYILRHYIGKQKQRFFLRRTCSCHSEERYTHPLTSPGEGTDAFQIWAYRCVSFWRFVISHIPSTIILNLWRVKSIYIVCHDSVRTSQRTWYGFTR